MLKYYICYIYLIKDLIIIGILYYLFVSKILIGYLISILYYYYHYLSYINCCYYSYYSYNYYIIYYVKYYILFIMVINIILYPIIL